MNMVAILIMSAIVATLDLLKIKVFWNKGYDVVIFAHNITNKVLSPDSNYITDAVMWPKFCNSSISMREVIIMSIFRDLTRKTIFFEGYPCFKFNNLGLALDIALKFYTSVANGLKLKVRKCFGLVLTGEKLTFLPAPILNRVKVRNI